MRTKARIEPACVKLQEDLVVAHVWVGCQSVPADQVPGHVRRKIALDEEGIPEEDDPAVLAESRDGLDARHKWLLLLRRQGMVNKEPPIDAFKLHVEPREPRVGSFVDNTVLYYSSHLVRHEFLADIQSPGGQVQHIALGSQPAS